MRSWLLIVGVLAVTMIQAQPPAAEKPYRIGGDVSSPRIISSVAPEYTQEARDAQRQGDVLIQLVVTRDGVASDVQALGQKIGFGLDEKAVECVRQWRFEPGKKGDQPVAVIVQTIIRFRLPR